MLLVVLIGFLPVVAQATEAVFSPKYKTCMDKSEGVTSNMLDCISDETKLQDKKLNDAYKLALKNVESRSKQLQEAQRSWIKYRDTNCNFYADPDGGTIASINSNSCFLEATAQRAKELEDLAN